MSLATASSTRRRRRVLRLVSFVIAAGVAVVVASIVVTRSFDATSADGADPAVVDMATFEPTAEDGLIRADEEVFLSDDGVVAIDRLDPALRRAMQAAEAAAREEGISFQITSGWRSEEYQTWLLKDAIEQYGSEDVARQYVATPDLSKHVTGEAVDIASLEAQLWLIENGSAYGICQTYANERWHFERVTAPGGVCPEQKLDARS